MKLGQRRNYHKGRAAIRHYANQPACPSSLLRQRPNFTSTYRGVNARVGQGPQTYFGTHGNQLPSLSGVHGFKDFVCSSYLVGSFDGRIYTLKHFD